MNTIINFFKDIDADILYFITSVAKFLINKLDIALNANKPLYHCYIDPIVVLIMIIVFGIPFVAMIVYAVVLHRRGKKMGVTYDHSKKIDDQFWESTGQDSIADCMSADLAGNIFNYADNDPQNPEYRYH